MEEQLEKKLEPIDFVPIVGMMTYSLEKEGKSKNPLRDIFMCVYHTVLTFPTIVGTWGLIDYFSK